MVVYKITSESILGGDTREFYSAHQAVYWIGVLARNNVRWRLEFRHENQPRQLELQF